MRGPRVLQIVVAVGAVAALTSACLSPGSSGASSASGDATSGSAPKKITIWTQMDAPVVAGLQLGLDRKLAGTGISAKLVKVDNINQLVMARIQANDVPDLATIPQPGVVAEIARRGKLTPLDGVLDTAALRASMIPGTLEAGTVDGTLNGLLVGMNVKSLVFYPKKAWAAAGYQVPRSIEELNALAGKIKASGTPPWCLGIGSDAATGWLVTDWFEDLVMRYGGAEQYNQWVSHQVKFDSPLVRQAAAQFEKVAFTDGNVLGGRKSIASNAFGTAGNPMFDAEPGCWLLKQASFITGFFPKQVQADLDAEVGVFAFPPVEAGGPNPMLGGGDMAILLKDGASARTVMNALASTDIGTEAAKGSSFLSPHKDFDATNYPNDLTRQYAEISGKASSFLFDGSDQMPGAVGSGTFWKDMTSWVSGQQDLDTTLKNIDASWPAN